MSDAKRPVGVALIGMGTVGTEVLRYMETNGDELAARIGAPLEIRGIAVRDTSKDRGVDPSLLTDDPVSLTLRDDVDVVVEVMGGIDIAKPLLIGALNAGKAVVTANKALLAEYTMDGRLAFAEDVWNS